MLDGAWPIIAGSDLAEHRFAMPDGVSKLYEAGSEGPVWWEPRPDPVRGLPAKGMLDRCMATNTCPKIIEHLGAAEVWGLDPDAGLDRHVGEQATFPFRPMCAATTSAARSMAAATAAST